MPYNIDRYARQVLFPGIGEEGQKKLLSSKVTLIGCGALGTVIANNLVRSGIGRTRIVDRDFIELNNLQRQILFDEDDIAAGLPKAVAAAQKLKRVNSQVEVEPVVADANYTNIESLIADADVVLDGTDNFETRYLINDACVKLDKPWIYGGVLASYGMTMTIVPGKTPCLRCVFPEAPAPGTAPTCDTAGVLGPAVNIIASMQSIEAMKILVGSDKINDGLLLIDVWENTFDKLSLQIRNEECPACANGLFEYLKPESLTQTTSLCGRDAVQVTVPAGRKVSFHDLAARLQASGQVTFNEYLLRFKAGDFEITVFQDARAIVKGTTDENVAKTLYARYIGM